MSESEIVYCVRDGISVKIESAKFTKDTKEMTTTVFEGKGLNVLVFTFHKNLLHFMDDQRILRRMEYEFPKRKFKIV